MDGTTVAIHGQLCCFLTLYIVEDGESVEGQNVFSDITEILLMLPIAIIVDITLAGQGIGFYREVRLFLKHSLPWR